MIVPQAPDHRRRVLREAGIREWYAKAGYVVEQNEYKAEPERKGFHLNGDSPSGHRVLSLDAMLDTWESDTMDSSYDGELEDGFEFDLEDESDDVGAFLDPDWRPGLEEEFLSDVSSAVSLTKGERKVTEWIVSGNQVVGADYTERMGDALGVSQNAAKLAWARARKKLQDQWATTPEERSGRLVHSLEGAGLWPGEYPTERRKWGRK